MPLAQVGTDGHAQLHGGLVGLVFRRQGVDKEDQQEQKALVFTATRGSASLPSIFTGLRRKGR